MTALCFVDGEPLRVPNLEAYWSDPAPYDAQRAPGQAAIDALFTNHRARLDAEQQARWAKEEA